MEEKTFFACIVGTGFGGIGMAIRLQQDGVEDFVMLEKADEVGGCWRENTYPGAACDVPSHLYSFSFEPKADWSRRYAPQPEILSYLKHCADKYDLRRRIRFGVEVASASFDEDTGYWIVTDTTGATIKARMLITACGQLSRPAYPKLAGLDQFQGAQFHSAHWDHSVDLRGKTVAVIGSGASAIQFVPEIAKQAGTLKLFQRSAPYVIPKPDRAYGEIERQVFEKLPWVQRMDRVMQYWRHEARALAFTQFSGLMKPVRWQFHHFMRRDIDDPALRQRLEPDYPIGCKRLLLSNDWFKALARKNVEVVTDGIDTVTATGIRTRDGQEHPVDVIIFGTGFQATDFLAPMQISGRNSVDLNTAWKEGAEAYLGMAVAGFPNLFMLYGPNTNLGHSSIVFMLESQIGYVMQAMDKLRAGTRWLDVKPQVQHSFNQRLQQRIRSTVWDQGCNSWYVNASGKNTNNWPGFTFEYRQKTRTLDPADYTAKAA